VWFRNHVVLPLRRFWLNVLKPTLKALDEALVGIGAVFGTRIRDRGVRALVGQGIYLVIYLIAVLSPTAISLPVLLFGYVGVLAVGRAWVANEKLRTLIAKKLADGDPDRLPDLRLAALGSALQLVILFPLLFRELYRAWGAPPLFNVPADANFFSWMAFTFEPNISDAVTGDGITFDPKQGVGRHLVTLKRLTVDLILVQGILRLFAITATSRESVQALAKDPEMARRLGRRAVEPLIDRLADEDAVVRENAALVLGQVGDVRAVEPLAKALADPVVRVRWRAATALGALRAPAEIEPLIRALHDPDLGVRTAAAQALGELGDTAAVLPLLTLVRSAATPEVRAAAISALPGLGDRGAVEALLEALADKNDEVSRAAAQALGVLGDGRAVGPLAAIVEDATRTDLLRYDAARALAALGDAQGVPTLVRALSDSDAFLRQVAAQALGELKAKEAIPALRQALTDADEGVRTKATEALAALGEPGA
jgi:HEAT repeat protein